MFKKLKEKLTEEVQQLSQLSPFTSGNESENVSVPPQAQLNELLVDISTIKPAGFNKELFSIDEDSREGTPYPNSEFQTVELGEESEESTVSPARQNLQLSTPFEPSALSLGRSQKRRTSDGSNISDVSSFFPTYEVPNVAFNLSQSDAESCVSEWDEGSSPIDKLSKDTIFQAYIRMKQRYHKYKGRYADLSHAYKENDKEMDKIKGVLTKTQDKAVRRIAELKEQCTLEQQAKAHLEQELRSDLEEKDHKIAALQTKVKLIQDGCLGEVKLKTSNADIGQEDENTSLMDCLQSAPTTQLEDSGMAIQSQEDGDALSVGSCSSLSTSQLTMESEELIDRLKGDVAKHKTLLSRCKGNIKSNKERIAELLGDKDLICSQLEDRKSYIETIKIEHARELESLRGTVESSALSMAETKQQMFKELQTKESEVEHYRSQVLNLQNDFKCRCNQISNIEEDINVNMVDANELDATSLVEKCKVLEELVSRLQSSKNSLDVEAPSLVSIEPALEAHATSDGECEEQNEIPQSNHELDLSNADSDIGNTNLSIYNRPEVSKSREAICESTPGGKRAGELINQMEALQKQIASFKDQSSHSVEDNVSLLSIMNMLKDLETDMKLQFSCQEKLFAEVKLKDTLLSELQNQKREQINQAIEEERKKDNQSTASPESLLQSEAEIGSLVTEIDILKMRIIKEETKNFELQEMMCKCSDGFAKYFREEYNNASSIEDNFDLIIKTNMYLNNQINVLSNEQAQLLDQIAEKNSLIQNLADCPNKEEEKDRLAREELQKEILYLQGKLHEQESENSSTNDELGSLQVKCNELILDNSTILTKYEEAELDRKHLTENVEAMKSELLFVENDKQLFMEESKKLETQLAELRSQVNDKQTLFDENKLSLDVLQTQMCAAEVEVSQLSGQVSELETQNSSLEGVLLQKTKQLSTETAKVEQLSEKMELCNTELENMKKEISHYNTEIKNKNVSVNEIEEKLNEITKSRIDEVNRLNQQISTAERKLDETQTENSRCMAKRESQFECELQHIQHLLTETNVNFSDLNLKHNNLVANMENTVQKMDIVENDKQLLNDKVQELESEKSQLDAQVNALMDEIRCLKEELSAELSNKITLERERKNLTTEISQTMLSMENVAEEKKRAENEYEDLIKSLRLQIASHASGEGEKTDQFNEIQEKNYLLERKIMEISDSFQKEKENVVQLNEEKSLLKSQIAELNSIRIEFSKAVQEKQVLESKYEQIYNENCLITDEVKILNAKNEMLTENCDMERNKAEKVTEELSSLQQITSKLNIQIESLTAANEEYSITAHSNSSQSSFTDEKNSLLAEIAKLKTMEREFSEFQDVVTSVKLSETNLKENLAKEQRAKTELAESITGLKEENAALGNVNQRYRDSYKDFEDTCMESGILITVTSDLLDIKAVLRNIVKERIELNEAYKEALSKIDKLNIDLDARICELQTATDNISLRENELSTLSHRVEDLECVIRSTEVTRMHSENLKTEPVNEKSTYSKEELEDRLKLVKSEVRDHYERLMGDLKECHAAKEKEWKASWEARRTQTDVEYQEKMEQITSEWSNERKELHRLTTVASEAFRNGTDSVDLLKKQVRLQRKEIDSLNQSHRKEINRLQGQLQSKICRSGAEGNLNVGTPLENAAEFDYLKNVLYEYMLGRETQTLSKVLCAVVKFDEEQRTKVMETEELKKNVIANISNSLKSV